MSLIEFRDARRAGIDWLSDLERVVSTLDQPRLVFQPIVDLARGVVAGYETLARFDASPYRSPDQWFAAAARLGYAAALEARVVERALAVVPSLPPGTFLSVNISPHLLDSPAVQAVLRGRDLQRVVLELTEHVEFGTDETLVEPLARVRRQGALIALDDAGSGYSGLQQLLTVRPDIVKLDRALVADADQDEAKLALVEMIGGFAGRLDAWLLAEGVETEAELESMIRLGVPLGQGYLLGHPGDGLQPALPQHTHQIRELRARHLQSDDVSSLLESLPTLSESEVALKSIAGQVVLPEKSNRPLVVVREDRCPAALLMPMLRAGDPAGGFFVVEDITTALATSGLAELARRAVARPAARRFEPVLCTDMEGRYVGAVRVERLITRLSDSA